MLCERGIRTFESHTRFTLPAGHRRIYLHETRPIFPVVVDPSHGTGHAYARPADGLPHASPPAPTG